MNPDDFTSKGRERITSQESNLQESISVGDFLLQPTAVLIFMPFGLKRRDAGRIERPLCGNINHGAFFL